MVVRIMALCAVLPMSLTLHAEAGEGWPLRNGDFSRKDDLIPQAQNPDWWYHRGPGVAVTREDREVFDPVFKGKAGDSLRRPGMVTLKAGPDQNAILFQKVWLLPGDYTFRVEAVSAGNATLVISAGGKQAQYSGVAWGETKVDFGVKDAGWVTVDLRTAKADDEVRVRGARIDVRKVAGSAVAMEDGRAIGAIDIPGDATEAEQYAAWELQKYIHRITGVAPGLKGRDETDDGVTIRIGRAAGRETLARLDGLVEDSFLVSTTGDGVLLAGNNDRGTLYAAYDLLKLQGCGWFWPGRSGEVVPERSALRLPTGETVESPDYRIRGLDKKRPDWDHASWRTINIDDYIDWMVRNRQNALLASQAMTVDFGKWRGGSHVLRTNHSLFMFWWGAEPIRMEWAPLVAGVRTPRHKSGRINMACTSSRDLRDRTVGLILKFFEQRPEATIFGLNTDDEPNNWCECSACRAQDSDEGKMPWAEYTKGTWLSPMTDRWLNFVNEIAARVTEVYPDKVIETYAYASTRFAPQRERVHPAVMVRLTVYPAESPYGAPVSDTSYRPNELLLESLEGWRRAGAKKLCLYDYDNYRYPDSVYAWFFRQADLYRTFHKEWGYRNYLAEHHGQFAPSYMEHNLRARLLWNTEADYRAEIRDVCDRLYGPVADLAYDYYIHLDQVILDYWNDHGDEWRGDKPPMPEDFASGGYRPLEWHEFTFEDMAAGKAILDRAWEAAGEDAALRERLAPLRFGHAFSTLVLRLTASKGGRTVSADEEKQAAAAAELARDLRKAYNILGSKRINGQLQPYYIPPAIKKELFPVPIVWKFKKDPGNQGIDEKWYEQPPDDSWTDIRTDSAWTSQGHAYHGVAWYSVELELPDDVHAELAEAAASGAAYLNEGGGSGAIYFGAVDGYADIYLDGRKIGEQKLAPAAMWRNPFAIRLDADAFAEKGKHRLTVRVQKESAAAGVWKPVRCVILAR